MEFQLPAGLDTLAQSEKGVTFPVFDIVSHEQAEMDGVPMTLTLKGSDSEAWTLTALEIERRNRKKVAAGEKIDAIADLCEQLAAVTTGWTGFHGKDKQPVQCSADQAAKMYRIAPAIRDQAYSRVTNRAGFTKASQNA